MKLSFVIRTLNEELPLKETLKRVNEQVGNFEFEVIVVDSGSTDKTIDVAQAYGCKIIKISQKEWSWGRSLNWGIREAVGEFICILSAHCYLTRSDFIIKAIAQFDGSPQLGAIYGQQIPITNYNPFEEDELETSFPAMERYRFGFEDICAGRDIGISNACCVLRRALWEDISYREDLQSLEDAVWASDVAQKGWQLGYTDTISVYHSHPVDPETIYRRWHWRTYESQNMLNSIYNKLPLVKKVKHLLRPWMIKPFLKFQFSNETQRIKTRVSDYSFVGEAHISSYLSIRNFAIIQGVKIRGSSRSGDYWSLSIVKSLHQDCEKLHEIIQALSVKKVDIPAFSHVS